MEILIISLLSIPFLYFNYRILLKDIKEKIIPNKYLLYLLYLIPIFFTYIFIYFNVEINYLTLFLQVFLSIFVSFLLYYFWIWWAWDAKYLLVLSLFLSHIWVISFIWNISILIISYLLLYFLYFYFWKCLIDLNYAKGLYKNIFVDLKDKFLSFLKNSDWNIHKNTTIRIILNWVLLFLFIFVSFRLTRLYLMKYVFSNDLAKENISTLFSDYYFHAFALIFLIFFVIRYLFRKFYNFAYHFLENKYWIIFKYDKTKLFLPITLIILLIGFIIYEFIINPYEIHKYLYRIFTFYIVIYIIVRILFYSYKLSFQLSETDYIELKDLKKWELIDKTYLVNMFWEQKCLGFNNENWILYPNPEKFFLKISNPIEEEDIEKLNEIYSIVDRYHIENLTPNYEKNDKIKILKSFAFAPYIFWWFLITLFFQDSIFKYINTTLIEFVKNIFSWS